MLDRMLAVISDPMPGRENEYNEWYDAVHLPEALDIPGFRGARRFRMVVNPDDPGHSLGASYLTLYDLDVDPERAVENLREAREAARLSPLSPAVETASIRRVAFEAVTEWVRSDEPSGR